MGPPPGMGKETRPTSFVYILTNTLPGGAPGISPAPGMSPPPGLGPAASTPTNPLPGRPQSTFQAPPNMPANINFNAPVIRLGASGAPSGPSGDSGMNNDRGNRSRMGLGADSRGDNRGGRDFGRERDVDRTFVPPTMEEVRRTIFVGGLEDSCPPDAALEEVLSCGGAVRLRRWTRLMDADNAPCKFGFAEYEDANSLHLVSEIFKDGAIEVPLRDKTGALLKNDDDQVKKTKLMVRLFSIFPRVSPLTKPSPGHHRREVGRVH